MSKHKHAEVIKAWADGAEIEVMNVLGDWIASASPEWEYSVQYRVKPAKVYPMTGLSWDDAISAIDDIGGRGGLTISESQITAVADAALRHAIDAGQVVMAKARAARDMAIAEAVRTWAVDRAHGPYEAVKQNYDWATQFISSIRSTDLAAIIAQVKP